MKNINDVKELVASSQDGKTLKQTDNYSYFILSSIEDNTNEEYLTNTDNLISDFKYMISQLQNAINVLEK